MSEEKTEVEPTDAEAETMIGILKHIFRVRHHIFKVTGELQERAYNHDKSKLSKQELPSFTQFTTKLKGLTYGSYEYNKSLEGLKPALDHHYANNRHHPEFHGTAGINGMNIIDLVEMLCDWKAAGERHNDGGDLKVSIQKSKERFGISDQLEQILYNSVQLFDDNSSLSCKGEDNADKIPQQ